MSLSYKQYTGLSSSLYILPFGDLDLSDSRLYERTYRNLVKLLVSGSPVSLIVFDSVLSSCDRDRVRKYYCSKAKLDKCNYVYFPFPCQVYRDTHFPIDPTYTGELL